MEDRRGWERRGWEVPWRTMALRAATLNITRTSAVAVFLDALFTSCVTMSATTFLSSPWVCCTACVFRSGFSYSLEYLPTCLPDLDSGTSHAWEGIHTMTQNKFYMGTVQSYQLQCLPFWEELEYRRFSRDRNLVGADHTCSPASPSGYVRLLHGGGGGGGLGSPHTLRAAACCLDAFLPPKLRAGE